MRIARDIAGGRELRLSKRERSLLIRAADLLSVITDRLNKEGVGDDEEGVEAGNAEFSIKALLDGPILID